MWKLPLCFTIFLRVQKQNGRPLFLGLMPTINKLLLWPRKLSCCLGCCNEHYKLKIRVKFGSSHAEQVDFEAMQNLGRKVFQTKVANKPAWEHFLTYEFFSTTNDRHFESFRRMLQVNQLDVDFCAKFHCSCSKIVACIVFWKNRYATFFENSKKGAFIFFTKSIQKENLFSKFYVRCGKEYCIFAI